MRGAIAAAEAIEAETCAECRGPRRRRKPPRERVRCARCADPEDVPPWTVPADAVMTPAEAAAGGWMHPDTCKRLRCCGWGVDHATALMNHDERETGIEGRHGWNHLARALLQMVLANQGPDGWQLVDLNEKWGPHQRHRRSRQRLAPRRPLAVLRRERQDLLALRPARGDAEPLQGALRRTAALQLLRGAVAGGRTDARRPHPPDHQRPRRPRRTRQSTPTPSSRG